MISLAALLRDATSQLGPVSDTPRLDAELLLAHALDWSRAHLLAHLDASLDTGTFAKLIARRKAHEPVAYILGNCEFFSLPLAIRPPILIPRPETEHLVELGLAYLDGRAGSALDLCTGSGCVAIALARHAPETRVTAVDIDPRAVALATENVRTHALSVSVFEGDLFAALPCAEQRFDLITANPPYVEDACWASLAPDIRDYESRMALLSGPDGLNLIRRIILEARDYLVGGGMLAMELGEQQYPAVAQLLRDAGYADGDCCEDLAGIQRIAHARWPG